MNISTNAPDFNRSSLQQVELERVMVELDQLKRQSERLDLINRLHARMAGVLSVAGMIEAYSVWLTPLVNHELIGYNNSTRKKRHLFCSGHGPTRRKAIAFAEQLIKEDRPSHGSFTRKDGHFAYQWRFRTLNDDGLLLILKEGYELTLVELELINHSLEILAECLRRGLEYEELFERASNDPLTGLYNRRVFEERIQFMIDSANRYQKPLSMITMDLDHFKSINDNLGHASGDEVLRKVADVMKSAVRSTDLLVRMGGDEFLIVLDNTDGKNGRVVAERLCHAIDNLEVWADENTKLGVSIGLTQLQDGEGLRAWMERTDDILYYAKAQGRSRVETD